MATTSNLSSIIRYYSEKQKSPFIDFKEFCAYIKKYAEHHVEEQADLVKYLGDPTNTVAAELQGLSEKHIAALITANNKKTIVAVTLFSIKFANKYAEILKNDSSLYPVISDLPRQFPLHILEKKVAEQYIAYLLENQNDTKSQLLYVLEFSRELPSLLLPACIPAKVLLETAQIKIRKILKKEEYHDYFLKKLRSTNPTKEISIKNFYTHFVDSGEYQYGDFTDGDDYYIWNQTLYYIRQDFEKIQDKTVEDVNILQAVQILEFQSSYMKEKFQENQKRAEALKELQTNLAKPPYFYSMNQILKFQDHNGKLLYGKYSEDDLKEFLQKITTEGKPNELPEMLVFKVASGTRYYVYKKKVIQVVVRLCNEAHASIEHDLEEKWYNTLLDYEKLPEMYDAAEFEVCLRDLVEKNSPILYSLLNANFMTLLAYEKDDDEPQQGFQLFTDGKLMTYSELLMLRNSKIYANAKARLPFIYVVPVLSWLMRLFNANKKSNKSKTKKQNAVQESSVPNLTSGDGGKKVSKAEALSKQAKELSKDIVPEGSTIDRELNFLVKQWNKMISKEAYNNLTEDVNSLIRDYTRRVVRTLSATSFTKERVEGLAKTLVNTPNMQKIHDTQALTEYVVLYIIRLVSN